MSRQPIATEYVDSALAGLHQSGLMNVPDPSMPDQMRDQSRAAQNDWIPWQAIDSTVSDDDVAELGSHFGGPLPEPYVAFLQYKHFYDLTESCLRFEPHVVGRWKQRLIEKYDRLCDHLGCDAHLIPIGEEPFMDAWPVCLDFKHRLPNGDCPVVFWDHEWVGTDKEICPMFSSTAKMFECLLYESESAIAFLYVNDDRDTPETLAVKRSMLSEFLKIDAEGAGGLARAYWLGRAV
ncbi:MAG TPA: SMI1/KNR4 family protein [Phycisphaerae bacterium]|nr:SMI1/KNR4 family protein [Phycisphaerae bacterium]